MPEVEIVLSLSRRSGVLAAVVAAVRRANLEFQSQRMVDDAGQPRLLLRAEGEPSSLESIEAAFESVRGVERVVEVLVDGVPLVDEPELPEVESEDPSNDLAPEPDATEQPESELDLEPEPELEPEAVPEASSGADETPESMPPDQAAEEIDSRSDSEANPNQGRVPTRAMVRRWRRRR
jgi:outer membrane biosynthesis protein TonB